MLCFLLRFIQEEKSIKYMLMMMLVLLLLLRLPAPVLVDVTVVDGDVSGDEEMRVELESADELLAKPESRPSGRWERGIWAWGKDDGEAVIPIGSVHVLMGVIVPGFHSD